MLQEPRNELLGGEGAALELSRAAIAIAEGHLLWVDALQAGVGDGDTVDVSGDVEESLVSIAGVPAVQGIKAFRRAQPRLIAVLNSIRGSFHLGFRSAARRRSLEVWSRDGCRGANLWRVKRGGA